MDNFRTKPDDQEENTFRNDLEEITEDSPIKEGPFLKVKESNWYNCPIHGPYPGSGKCPYC
jgi:hypothetical protein